MQEESAGRQARICWPDGRNLEASAAKLPALELAPGPIYTDEQKLAALEFASQFALATKEVCDAVHNSARIESDLACRPAPMCCVARACAVPPTCLRSCKCTYAWQCVKLKHCAM